MVAIIGVTASIAVWYLTFSAEQRAMVQEFNGRANNQAIIMENGVDDYWDELYAVRDFFNSLNENVTREEFETFSTAQISRHTAILNIAWAPRIERERRVAHELAAADDGFTDYHIRASGPDGRLIVSPVRDEYYPRFGTGYSSLGYLRGFPFDRIKIDQSFIRDLAKDKESLAIVRAVVGLGRGLGIVTTLKVSRRSTNSRH